MAVLIRLRQNGTCLRPRVFGDANDVYFLLTYHVLLQIPHRTAWCCNRMHFQLALTKIINFPFSVMLIMSCCASGLVRVALRGGETCTAVPKKAIGNVFEHLEVRSSNQKGFHYSQVLYDDTAMVCCNVYDLCVCVCKYRNTSSWKAVLSKYWEDRIILRYPLEQNNTAWCGWSAVLKPQSFWPQIQLCHQLNQLPVCVYVSVYINMMCVARVWESDWRCYIVSIPNHIY